MKKPNWSVLLLTSVPGRKSRTLRLGKGTLAVLICCAAFGAAGLFRCAYVVGSFGFARVGVYALKKVNEELLQKISDLDHTVNEHTAQIGELVAFEDSMRLRFGLPQISKDVRKAGIGGFPTAEEVLLSSLDPNVARTEALRTRIAALDRQVELQRTTFAHMADHVLLEYQRWAHLPSGWPTQGRLTSTYGYRFHPMYGARIFHEGIDIANSPGTPVYATADGIIASTGWQNELGITVVIKHPGSGLETVYAHLRSVAVDKAQKRVRRGELIGYMGSTGRSTGSHLHYEVRRNKAPLDPLRFILPPDVIVD